MNEVQPSSDPHQPTGARERFAVLDALRGFALFGILFVNLTWFTGFAVIFAMTPDQIEALGTLQIDTIVNWLVLLLVDSKFWTIFALLFGLGLGMQLMRLEAKNEGLGLLARRLAALLVIGLAHGIFLWFGDIVSLYAAAGFVFLLFARLSKTSLLVCAAVLLLLPIVQSGVWLFMYQQFQVTGGKPPDLGHGPVELLPSFSHGNFVETFEANWAYFTKRWFRAICEGRFYKLLGFFLLGYYAARMNWFGDLKKHRKLFLAMLIGGLAIGLPANWAYANAGGGSILPMTFDQFKITVIQNIGIPALAVGYVGGFVLAFSYCPRFGLWSIYANVGRLSLTNYVFQSAVCIVVFYGCCFGLWGKFGITWSLAVILIFFLVQSALSYLWLKAFRFGPLEWVCRCLTYRKILPLKRSTEPADTASGANVQM